MTLDKKAGAMWHVLRLINNNLTEDGQAASLNLYHVLNRPSSAPPTEYQLAALHQLRDQGIVAFDEGAITYELLSGSTGPEIQITNYPLTILKAGQLKVLYGQHQRLEQQRLDAQPISLSYDPASGIGLINGTRELRLRGKNKRVFSRLYADVNKWVERAAILKAVGYKHGYGSKQATLECNTLTTNLRKATALTPQHIVVHDGQLMLKAAIVDSQF